MLADFFAIAARASDRADPHRRIVGGVCRNSRHAGKDQRGKERKLPPPATLFNIPAAKAARAGTKSWAAVTPPRL